ncbi:MAG: type II secretion system protein [Candidatus Omnitrophica bacterium]|nr:type II secretion system protein [Candidatus Omnitrophota bacterium]MDD5655038.1 type II secretion system protein [Candidatus Omnitrophota bacterium]
MRKKEAPRGFTLVELMVAVAVFAVGSVFVLRSFLSSASALASLEDRVSALQIAQSQMDALEEQALQGKLTVSAMTREQAAVNNRSAVKEVKVQDFYEETWQKKLLKADVSVKWQEADREKDVRVSCYIKNQK